jgi:hypothetical protein
MAGAAIAALGGCMFAGAGGSKPDAAAAVAPPSHAAPSESAPAAVVSQQQRQEFTATLAQGESVTVDNPYGDVRLRFGGFTHTIEVDAVAQTPGGAPAIDLKPGTEGARYVIAPRIPQGTTLASGQRIDLVVFVPIGHPVAVHTEHGLIESHGIRADIDLRSTAGDIAVRGTQGVVQAQTGAGQIEASLNTAPPKSQQRLATTTGNIVVGVSDKLDAELVLATSGVFATEYSLDIARLQGQEPNKRAHSVVGAKRAHVNVESRRGEIRILRRAEFTSLDGKPADEEHEDNDAD